MHGLIAPRPARPSQPSKTHRCQLPPGLVARRHVRETRDRPWLANSVLSDKSASKPEASPSFTPARDSSASTTAYQPPQLQQQPTTTTTPSEGAGSTSSRTSSPTTTSPAEKPTLIPSAPSHTPSPEASRPRFLTRLGLAIGRVRAKTCSKIPAPVRKVSPTPPQSFTPPPPPPPVGRKSCLKSSDNTTAGPSQPKQQRVAFAMERNTVKTFERQQVEIDDFARQNKRLKQGMLKYDIEQDFKRVAKGLSRQCKKSARSCGLPA